MANIEEKIFIIELLRLYRSFPALWDVNHKDYNNNFLKHQQYEILLAKYRETYPNGYMRDLKKRITSLRKTYRREMRRLAREGRNEASSLYYFKELSFLKGIETIHSNQERLQDIKDSNNEENKEYLNGNVTLSPPTAESFYEILSNSNIEIEEIEIKPDLGLLLENYTICDPTLSKIGYGTGQMAIKHEMYQQPHTINTCSDELIKVESQQTKVKDISILLPTENYKQKQDTCQPLWSKWSEKLTQIDTSQRVLAEKLINDVFFNAELGLLNLNTSITNLTPFQSLGLAKEKNEK